MNILTKNEEIKKSIIPDQDLILEDYKRYFVKQLNQGIIIKERELPQNDSIINWFYEMTHLHSLKKELLNHDIREIIIHNQSHIHLDIGGKLCPINLPSFDYGNFNISLKWLTLTHNIKWNISSPFASFGLILNNLPIRITLLHSCLTPSGECHKVFIRKLNKTPLSFHSFELTNPEQELLKHFIQTKKNIVIAGATNSGKTTFLQTLLSLVPQEEHVIILEDTHELNLPSPYVTHLLGREEVKDQSHSSSLKNFMSMSLRLRPDRIVLGEIRSNEVIPFLLGLNTGHKGLMSTIHANSAEDALERLILLFTFYHQGQDWDQQSLKTLISKGLDYIIFMEGKRIKKITHLRDF